MAVIRTDAAGQSLRLVRRNGLGYGFELLPAPIDFVLIGAPVGQPPATKAWTSDRICE
jgi:hypothetical protein